MPETFAFISHSHKQLARPAPGRELWISHYFGLKRDYAEAKGWEWAVMSPAYGIVLPSRRVAPYDWRRHRFVESWPAWANGIAKVLAKKNVNGFVVLGGAHYVRAVEVALQAIGRGGIEVAAPLRGLSIGRKLQFLERGGGK